MKIGYAAGWEPRRGAAGVAASWSGPVSHRPIDSGAPVQGITKVSISYANALVDLAKEKNLLDAVHTDVDGLQVRLGSASYSPCQ